MNRMLMGNIPKEVAQKKTGRVSDVADADYISANLFEKKMSATLYNVEGVSDEAVSKLAAYYKVSIKEIFVNFRESFSLIIISISVVPDKKDDVNHYFVHLLNYWL